MLWLKYLEGAPYSPKERVAIFILTVDFVNLSSSMKNEVKTKRAAWIRRRGKNQNLLPVREWTDALRRSRGMESRIFSFISFSITA